MTKKATSAIPSLFALAWLISIIFVIYTNSRFTVLIVGIFPVIFYIALKEYTIRLFLKCPPRTHKPELVENWQIIERMRDGFPVRALYRNENDSKSLIVLIHGWTSSTGKMKSRLNWWNSQGFASLAIELRGHGHAEDEHEWTAQKVADDLSFLLDELKEELSGIERILFYGHSLGGFILLRLMKQDKWWQKFNDGIILESPMTSYKMILEENRVFNSSLNPLIKRWLIKAWSAIHPDNSIKDLTDVETPNWGMPPVRTLLLQAERDKRLGRSHFDHIVESFEKVGSTKLLTAHLVHDLSHSRNDDCKQRDELISSWL